MNKSKKFKTEFTAQPYPLYAWGMWAEPVHDDETDLIGFTYFKDRLTIAGWMQMSDRRVEPMVVSHQYGVIHLYELMGPWQCHFNEETPSEYTYLRDSENTRIVCEPDFVLVEVTMAEPHSSVFDATKEVHLLNAGLTFNKYGVLEEFENPTVVDDVFE